MSNRKFTPAPWHVGGRGNRIVYAENGYAVASCTVHHGMASSAETEANARLIASAPEMQVALERMAALPPDTPAATLIDIARSAVGAGAHPAKDVVDVQIGRDYVFFSTAPAEFRRPEVDRLFGLVSAIVTGDKKADFLFEVEHKSLRSPGFGHPDASEWCSSSDYTVSLLPADRGYVELLELAEAAEAAAKACGFGERVAK